MAQVLKLVNSIFTQLWLEKGISKKRVQSGLNHPCYVDNNTHMLALAGQWFGEGKGSANVSWLARPISTCSKPGSLKKVRRVPSAVVRNILNI